MEACIARHASLLSPPLPMPSLPLPLPSLLTTSPTDTGSPLGYRAAEITMRSLLPFTSRRTDIPEADVPPRNRACLTTLALKFEAGESSAAGAARQPGPTESDLGRYRVEQAGYGITDTWDEIVDTLMEIAPTTLEGIEQRVTELDTITQLTTALGRIEILEARDLEPQEGPVEAGNSYEPASPVRDDSQGEDCPTDSGFITDQDRATIAKSSTLPCDSAPRVTSPAAEEGRVIGDISSDDAPIKGRSTNEWEAPAERISTDSEEIARVLTSMDAATVLVGETNVPTGSGSIPTAGPHATIVSTGSEVGPTAMQTPGSGISILLAVGTPSTGSGNLYCQWELSPGSGNALRSNRRRIPNIVEPEIRTIAEIIPMADRTMEELLQAPTEGYGEVIVISEILAENFKIKTNLLQLVQDNKFYGRKNDNPHTHINNFKRMTATLKYRDVPNDAIKLMLFPYSLEDRARIWYENEPPNSILTWDDLVNKFVNQFFPPSKTTHLKNEISRFTQRFDETFSEDWDCFKGLLRACPHHGFSELTQIDTFYNGLTEQDQDSLNAASGANLLNKTTREALQIIENKSKVRYSRSKSNVSRVNTNSRDVVSKTDDRIDKLADQISNLVEIVNKQVIAPAKAVKKTCFTCRGAHAYYECIATDSNPSSVCAATSSYNQVSPPNRASYQIPPPGFAPVQNNPNRFNQGFQSQQFLVPNNQILPSVPNEFLSYIKLNEIAIKSMQNHINVLRGDFSKQEENLRRNLNDDMRNILSSFFQNQPSTSGTLLSNIIPNQKGEMKAVTTRSGLAYEGPSIPTESPLQKVDEKNTEEILDKEYSNSSGCTAQVQPPVVPILILEPDVPRTQSKPIIPYPSRLNDQKLREKATNQMKKLFQILHDLHFDISFADALLLMPKFASTIKSLPANKDKLFELAKVLLNKNCSAMLLKKLPKKLGDPGKFLIPCDFPGMEVCHALADLGANINLMPLSIWKKLSLPELTPTRMTLDLADRSITRPKGIAEDVFVKGEEITLRVNDESITFNLDQVMKYSDNSIKRVNVINIAFEEVVHDNTKSSNPTLVFESDFCEDPIVKTSPFGESEDPFQLPPMNLNQAKSPIEEPKYAFSMGYEHFITTPVTKLNEVAESSAKNLVPIQSEYEVTSDNESEYNEPINDDSFLAFTTFTNPLFNDKDDFTIYDEDVPIEESKVYLNPLFDDDEIYSDELESHVESNLVESLSNHDTLKFDHLDEFSGALMPIHIAEEERIRREHAEYIGLMERLITINPCPRPTVIANMNVKSLPSSIIPVQDNDSQREDIDIVTDTDELLPPGFENDDSEGEINVVEELRVDNFISNSKNELSDNEESDHDNPLVPCPPPKPPDVEFDFEPNSREVIAVVMNNFEKLIDDVYFSPVGEIDVSTNVEDYDYFPFTFVIRIFLHLELVSPFRASGISSGWNFHVLSCLSKHY
nr:reverse transcriptase domain-containing protein [Tanacetum cinerariifolium]